MELERANTQDYDWHRPYVANGILIWFPLKPSLRQIGSIAKNKNIFSLLHNAHQSRIVAVETESREFDRADAPLKQLDLICQLETLPHPNLFFLQLYRPFNEYYIAATIIVPLHLRNGASLNYFVCSVFPSISDEPQSNHQINIAQNIKDNHYANLVQNVTRIILTIQRSTEPILKPLFDDNSALYHSKEVNTSWNLFNPDNPNVNHLVVEMPNEDGILYVSRITGGETRGLTIMLTFIPGAISSSCGKAIIIRKLYY